MKVLKSVNAINRLHIYLYKNKKPPRHPDEVEKILIN